MAAGLGYIEFSTGDILTAASANGYLASQTVMVFASAAARTSAIASPQEGMMSYLKDTNAVEYYSGSAWLAVGGSSSATGLTLLNTTSFSSVASVSLAANSFTSTYSNYKLVINISNSSNSGYLNARLRASGSDNSTSNYTSGFFVVYQATTVTTNDSGAAGENTFNKFSYLYTGQGENIEIDIFNPQATAKTSYTGTVSGHASEQFLNSGYFNATTSFDSFTFYQTGGSLTGSYSLYGYNK